MLKDGKAREKLHKLEIDAQTGRIRRRPGGREGVDIMDWRHEAACREVDPELFFPIGNSGPALLQIEEAKQVCRRCSVMEECLRWAIESGQDAGVWGGMGEDERRALKRRTIRLRAAPTCDKGRTKDRGPARPPWVRDVAVLCPGARSGHLVFNLY